MLIVDEVIGRGSFGTVYRGRMQSSDGLVRRVAVKVLSDEMSRDSRAVARFRDEARLLALVDHPGLVPVYALEKFEDRWAVVMGYVDGFELAGAVRYGPLPPETVRQIGIQTAEILEALWTHPHPESGEPLRVVHRDVKPQNMMIDTQGRVRLLDLGVASARFDARESRSVAGEVAGTLAYMSPQRWARRDDRHAGDVYSLGATLYQLATGRLAQEAGADATSHRERVGRGAEGIPEPLYRWIERAMAFDDGERPDAASMAAGLRDLGALEGPSARDWANAIAVEHELRSSGVPQSQRDSSFLGRHEVGTDTIMDPRPDEELATLPSLPEAPPTAGTPIPERRRSGWRAAGAVAAVLALAAILWAALDGPSAPGGTPITVALAPTDPTTVEADTRILADALGRAIGHPLVLRVGDSYEHTAHLLLAGEVDFAQMPHRTGILAMEQDPSVYPLATKIVDGTQSVDPFLVVRRTDTGRTTQDFLGSTICYADPMSSTGYAIPRAWIQEQGFDPDSDFGTHISGDHAQVLRDVIEGTCRLGGTFNRNLMTAEQRGIPGSRLRILAMTGDPIPHDSWYAAGHSDPEIARALAAALLAFDPREVVGTEVVGEHERISGFRAPPHAR